MASDCPFSRSPGTKWLVLSDDFDQVQVAANDGVIVDIGNLFQRILDLGLEVLCRHVAFGAGRRIEPRHENGMQRPRDLGIAAEHRRDEALALRDACLLQIAAVGAQDSDCRGAKPRRLGKHIVTVIVGLTAPDGKENLLEKLASVREVYRPAKRVFELHVVHEDRTLRPPRRQPRMCAR